MKTKIEDPVLKAVVKLVDAVFLEHWNPDTDAKETERTCECTLALVRKIRASELASLHAWAEKHLLNDAFTQFVSAERCRLGFDDDGSWPEA